MKHVALTVAGWWVTWVLFGIVAYFGVIVLICRAFGWLHSRDVAAGKAAAADDLGYGEVRSILDDCTLTAWERDVLREIEREFGR